MVNRDKGLIWKTGEFDTSMLSNEYYYFKVIEDEINIQDIEELKYETVIEKLGAPDCFQGNEIYCLKTLSKNDENLLISNAENHKKINEIIRALKYIDNKIKEK